MEHRKLLGNAVDTCSLTRSVGNKAVKAFAARLYVACAQRIVVAMVAAQSHVDDPPSPSLKTALHSNHILDHQQMVNESKNVCYPLPPSFQNAP